MKHLAFLLLPLAAFAAAPATDWSPNLTTNIAWQGNVSNGEASWDRIGTLELNADSLSSSQYALGTTDLFHATVHLGGAWYPRFSQLGRGLLGARVDWQHTFGADEFAPVLSIEAAGDATGTVETARRGVGGGVTVKLSKRFGTAWRAAVSQRFDEYNAKRSVFDNGSRETGIEVSRDLNGSTRLAVSGRWRQGDVVTYAQYDRPDLVGIAHDSAELKTFRTPMTAYATDARTLGGRVAVIHATAEDSAIVLAYDYAQTKRSALRFANWTVSLGFIHQY